MLEEAAQRWHPTHVQVTVLQARNLHPKGKHGTNDAYTIIHLGKEKYSTSVVEKSLSPVWKEEASFELPGLLLDQATDHQRLQLTVMHRSLVGLDKFLGQVTILLHSIFQDRERCKTQWYPLESRQGKRRKERGELQLSIHFMRNNMTASMFDLSMKDKSRSPFSRLKDKMKGRKPDGTDTSSAIIPASTTDQLHQPPSDHPPDHQPRDKAKKPFLLGPQRLSSAHSMSDLIVPPPGRSPGMLDTISSAQESGLTSPHRRTMSADTSQDDHSEEPRGEDPRDPPPVGAAIPPKFATLPRQWAPGDERGGRAAGGRKKEKISLLERVTGKKDTKRPDLSDWSSEELPPSSFPSTNPFRASGGHPADLRSLAGQAPVTSVPRGLNQYPALPGSMDPGPGVYGHLTRSEVECELSRHKELLRRKEGHIRELEDYIDNLLVRVMEETPSILRVPYVPSRRAGKFGHS